MTYYIIPARYAISFSDRRYRSRNSIRDAQKLGRTPPFIYTVLSFEPHVHSETTRRTYKIDSDTIKQSQIHLSTLGRVFPRFPLPLRKSRDLLEIKMISKV